MLEANSASLGSESPICVFAKLRLDVKNLKKHVHSRPVAQDMIPSNMAGDLRFTVQHC